MALIGRVPTEESVIGDWEHKTSAAPLERVCQKLTIVKPARYYLISVGIPDVHGGDILDPSGRFMAPGARGCAHTPADDRDQSLVGQSSADHF